jgi:hypothetical protein
MIKLNQLLESSARDRLKKRVKNVDIEKSKTKNLAPYLRRVTKLYESRSRVLEERYTRFHLRCVLRTPERSSYLTEVVILFSVILVDGSYTFIDFPRNQNQALLDGVEKELEKLVKSMDIPRKFDLETVAILLQFLEERGFKLQGV